MKKIYLTLIVLAGFSLSACNLQKDNTNEKQETKIEQETAKQKLTTKEETTKQVQKNTPKTNEKQTDKNKEGVSNGNKFVGFVATWCPHCQDAVPVLEEFATNTNGQLEINVIDKKAFPGVKNLKQEYESPKSYVDYTNEECGYIPSYVILDKDGKVIEKKCGGALDYEQLKSKLLGGKEEIKQDKKKVIEQEQKTTDTKKEQGNLNNNNKQMTNKVVENGDKIAVDYIGKFTDGKVFDTSIESIAKENNLYNSARTYKPLEFEVGAGQMIPCFDKGVVGMKIGETKEITCEPKDAYGECDPKKIIKVEKAKLADFEKNGYKLEKGVELPTQYGMLKITDVKDDIVYLDTNHPMCGKKLIFTVTLKEIK